MGKHCDNCKPDLCLFAGGGSGGGGGGGGGGSSTLSGLTDVDISNPTNGQTLVYNATSGKWENGAGGGVLVVKITQSDDTLTFDKTWQEIYDADAVSIVQELGIGNKSYITTCAAATIHYSDGGGASEYIVVASNNGDSIEFITNSASGYPSYTFG